MLGITVGFGVLVMAVGLSLAGVVHAEPRLHTVLRFAGGAYLLYLAWCIARADAGSSAPVRAKPISVFEAALFQRVNPKGWVFALGALAAYTTVGGDVLWETSVIATVLAMAVLASVVIWAGFGAGIGRLLGNRRAHGVQLVDGRLVGIFPHTSVLVRAGAFPSQKEHSQHRRGGWRIGAVRSEG